MIIEDNTHWTDPTIYMMEKESLEGFSFTFNKATDNVNVSFCDVRFGSWGVNIPISTFEDIVRKIKEAK